VYIFEITEIEAENTVSNFQAVQKDITAWFPFVMQRKVGAICAFRL
jgi:hypothetical protein